MGQKMMALLKQCGHEYCAVDVDTRCEADNFDADIIVDFSSSDCLKENLDLAVRKNIPIVIGTTNHSDENFAQIDKFKTRIPIFMASNFSILFNVLLELCSGLKSLKHCDILVEEVHHKHKKDSPSGSCKEILKILQEINIAPQVTAHRVGEVIGNHSIKIYNGFESMEISHEVSDREVFCEGALRACEFLLNKPCGLYTMKNLLE